MPIVLFLHPPPDPPGEDEEMELINKEEVPSFAAGSELEHIYNVSLFEAFVYRWTLGIKIYFWSHARWRQQWFIWRWMEVCGSCLRQVSHNFIGCLFCKLDFWMNFINSGPVHGFSSAGCWLPSLQPFALRLEFFTTLLNMVPKATIFYLPNKVLSFCLRG